MHPANVMTKAHVRILAFPLTFSPVTACIERIANAVAVEVAARISAVNLHYSPDGIIRTEDKIKLSSDINNEEFPDYLA